MSYEKERKIMVETQLRSRGIKDERVLNAMESVERHLFVDKDSAHRAYDDCALPIGYGQTISQPYMVAVMTESLQLKGNERVLEIGTGSGYQAAVLSKLAAWVVSVERIKELATRAKKKLRGLGIENVQVIIGDGTSKMFRDEAFDGIIVTAGAPKIPDVYISMLKKGGRLVIPVGSKYSQILYSVTKTEQGVIEDTSTPCVFVPLVGKNGWQDASFY